MRVSPFLILIFFLGSCSNALSPEAYIQWFDNKENGMHSISEMKGFEYTVSYRSPEYMTLRESNAETSGELFDSLFKEYSNYNYFLLKIRNKAENKDVIKNGEGEQAFTERLMFYSEGIRSNIALLNGADTLLPEFVHLERSYNISSFTQILLCFEKKEQPQFNILFNDIPNNNLVNLVIEGDKLRKVPELKLNHN